MKYSRARVSNYQRKVAAQQQANFNQANFIAMDPTMLWEQAQNAYQMYGPQAMDYLQQGVQGAQQLGGQLADQAGNLVNQASPYFEQGRQAIGQVAGQVAGQVSGLPQALANRMPDLSGAQQAAQGALQQGGSLIDQYGRPLMQYGQDALQQAGKAIQGMSPMAKNAALGAGVVGTGVVGAGASMLRNRGRAQQPVQAAPQAVEEVAQVASNPGLRQRAMGLASNPLARKVGIGAGIAAGVGAAGLGGKALYDQMQGANYSHKIHNIATFCSNPSNFTK